MMIMVSNSEIPRKISYPRMIVNISPGVIEVLVRDGANSIIVDVVAGGDDEVTVV